MEWPRETDWKREEEKGGEKNRGRLKNLAQEYITRIHGQMLRIALVNTHVY